MQIMPSTLTHFLIDARRSIFAELPAACRPSQQPLVKNKG
jgi:hypothetical protein